MDITLIAIIVAAMVWGIIAYNRLIAAKNLVLAAWSDIEVQLKRRHDLIPKLLSAVNAYAHYESKTLESIIDQRSHATSERPAEPATRDQEHQLTQQVKQLLLLVEDYPELKASAQYLQLLQQLTEVENHIQYARRFYNGSVRDLNVRIDSFPDLIIARLFKFEPALFFELESAVEQQPPETT